MAGDDAVDAVLQVAAVLDDAVQSGRIPAELGVHAGAMLMVIRDYVRPLPVGLSEDGTDRATRDLEELVKTIRRVGGAAGLQG